MSPKLRTIADQTIAAIEHGSYDLDDVTHDLAQSVARTNRDTRYFAPDSLLSSWSAVPTPDTTTTTDIAILEISTLQGSRLLSNDDDDDDTRIGILNFASAKRPGGGFLRGAQAQEESLARSSTLYPSLTTDTARTFYALHARDPKRGYYSHAMLYSPRVLLFRDDAGAFLPPTEVDVLTSPAVNAGLVRRNRATDDDEEVEARIEQTMRERMARILYLFERQRARRLVLGSFGTGVFRNDVPMVARIWADLIAVDGARFKSSFDRVLFAILGRATFEQFKQAFEERTLGPQQATASNQDSEAVVVVDE